MDFHLCKEEKFVYGHNIKALVHTCDILYVSILQSVFLSRSFTFTFAKCFPWSIFYFYFYFCQVFSLVGLLLLMLEILAETVTSIKISTTSAPTLILIILKGEQLLRILPKGRCKILFGVFFAPTGNPPSLGKNLSP